MFALFEHWFDDPAKITVGAVLFAGIVAYHFITKWYFTEFRKISDITITQLREECKQEREGRERLMTIIERLTSATEVTAHKVAGGRR